MMHFQTLFSFVATMWRAMASRRSAPALMLLASAMALSPAHAQPLPAPDPQDGKTFRAIVFHDIRTQVKASFERSPEESAVDDTVLAGFFEWLRVNDYHPVSLQQIADAHAGRKPLPPRAVLLTVDDGYTSFYTKFYQLQKQYRYPAVLAVVTRWMETPADQQVLYGMELRPRSDFITWAQAREMVQSGLVELASHSHDLHHGVLANASGSLMPAAIAHAYDGASRQRESDAQYLDRVGQDLRRSRQIIEQRTGAKVRALVWPYGAYNARVQQAAQKAGFSIMATLADGPNDASGPLTAIRRAYATYELSVGQFAQLLRQPTPKAGNRPYERAMHVDLDYVYDPDPAQQERNLSALVERVAQVRPRSVFLQAYADADGDGVADALYFPNRHMPMKADLFNRVAWQLATRAGVQVYAWMPVMGFRLPPGHPAASRQVLARGTGSSPPKPASGRYLRLSPFDPEVRRTVRDIYDDLGRSARFQGVLFHDDAFLDDDEDASPAAMQAYAQWGLPQDIDAIRKDRRLHEQWARGKSRTLIDFTQELAATLRQWQPELLTARNLYARPLLQPAAHEWLAQDYEEFLRAYDYVAIMAMPYMEGAANPQEWLGALARRALAVPAGKNQALFELQTRDWRTGRPIPDQELLRQSQQLRIAGVRHIGLYPDDFHHRQPATETLRQILSVSNHLPAEGKPGFHETARLQ